MNNLNTPPPYALNKVSLLHTHAATQLGTHKEFHEKNTENMKYNSNKTALQLRHKSTWAGGGGVGRAVSVWYTVPITHTIITNCSLESWNLASQRSYCLFVFDAFPHFVPGEHNNVQISFWCIFVQSPAINVVMFF